MIDNVAKAMETRRRELIAQPLNRIWPELARAAIEAMHEPTDDENPEFDPALIEEI